jgi:hypothetical protein
MVAALLKILHSGIQDLRLLPPKGQPKTDFFQKVFIKAGRFTTQWVRLEFDQTPDFGKTVACTLPRQGHLISRVYLVTTFPDIATKQQAAAAAGTPFAGPIFGWTNSLGHAVVQQATVTIGGEAVDTLDSRLLEVMDEFTTPLEKVTVVNEMIQRYDNGFTSKTIGWESTPTRTITPLPFWFSRGDSGVFLPIDAISQDLVRLSVNFASLGDLFVSQELSGSGITLQTGKVYPQILNSPFYKYTPTGVTIQGFNGQVTPIPDITMPKILSLGETYLMVEYIYLDKSEANRFRLADITVPIVQHYAIDPYDTRGFTDVSIPIKVPNPTRDFFFFAQRYEAPAYNAPFLATRDLSSALVPIAPWWPDAVGLNPKTFSSTYAPGFSTRESEPISSIVLLYEGKLMRYGTTSPALFRSILPSFEQKKSPWVNRYYYTLSFGVGHGTQPPSMPSGEANLDKIRMIQLQLRLSPNRGCLPGTSTQRFIVYCWAETYNILRIYGGRAALLFAY